MKKPPLAERAVAAIARYERAAADLAAIKKGIVAELAKCPITIEAWEVNGGYDLHPTLWDNGRENHHLHRALNMESYDSWDHPRKLYDYEIRYELEGDGEDETLKCEHCLAAWALIERRKLARQEFGQAKRMVRALGKQAIQAEPKPPEKPCAARECQHPRADGTMFCG
ncbi:MAG: hypothetical protein E6R08_09295 [Nevskiaceae bacterium]|nr:MAG: hypothetical protein E6R08_09295 [Nevskiaceae bacterium]